MGMKNALKWKRASIIYPSNHIVSSKAREFNDNGFTPTYDKGRPNLCFLLSYEYMRLWFKERDAYQKENYAKLEKTVNDTKLRRRIVQRMMTNPKQQEKELPIIQLKRFQNIPSKVDNRRSEEEKRRICERYHKTIEPIKLQRFKPDCRQKT